MADNPDFDIFEKNKKEQAIARGDLPSVEEMPVLTDLRKMMDVDLAVNIEGRVYVFYEGKIPERTEYVQYSIDDSSLHLISYEGRIQGIGMKVHQPMQKYMSESKEIYVVEMIDGAPGEIFKIPMNILKIGL